MNNTEFAILFVNDSDGKVETLFSKKGYIVQTALPQKAINILVNRRIDLVLLDVDLVKEKAVTLVGMVRRLDRSTPIVTLATTYTVNGYDIEIDLRQAGVLACRGKPLTEEEAGWLIDSAKSYFRNRSSQAFGR